MIGWSASAFLKPTIAFLGTGVRETLPINPSWYNATSTINSAARRDPQVLRQGHADVEQ